MARPDRSAGHRVPNMAAVAGHVFSCCRLWTHNSSHGGLRLSTHVHAFFVRRGPPEIIEITARDHCPTARRSSPLLTALAAPQLRSSARIPALTPARLPLVLVGSRRLSLSRRAAAHVFSTLLVRGRATPATQASRVSTTHTYSHLTRVFTPPHHGADDQVAAAPCGGGGAAGAR